MEEESLCVSLLDMISSKTDADEIIYMFYELYGALSPRDLFLHRRLFLRAATEHNHTELRVLLLANTRHGDPSDVTRNKKACYRSHTMQSDHEIVKLLLSRKEHQKHRGVRRLLSAGPTTFSDGNRRRNPLECFVGLGRLFYTGELTLALPEIVQLLINAGADVFPQLSTGITPLSSLMEEVKHMWTYDVDFAHEGRHNILETTRVLLDTGSKMGNLYNQQPIDHLLTVHVYSADLFELRASSLQYKLISALYELLLMHINMTTAKETFIRFLGQAGDIAEKFNVDANGPDCLEHCNSIIESFTNILRCISLSTAQDIKITYSICFSSSFLNSELERRVSSIVTCWIFVFRHMAVYASSPGRSTKLICLILSILSTSNLANLKKSLKLRITNASNLSGSEDISKWSEALKWIDEVQRPFRLEHLASRTVIRAMSSGALRNASRLGLPHHIQQSVLLNFD